MTDILRIRLPFREQIDFFRGKLNLPTERWDDILKAAHDRAFIVAGAMSADLLDDLHQAVDGAITGGTTLDQFRAQFRDIVAKRGWHGWTGEGTQAGEAWRTRVIFNTNVATSYAAGRWQQLHDPDLLKVRPYWRYIHNDSVTFPRPLHKRWGDEGLTLRHDHDFWKTHFPPNGWGCRCRVKAVRGPREGDATEPPAGWDVKLPKTGAPDGIDKGWDYAPGANAKASLRDLVDRKLIQLDAPIGAAMAATLRPALALERELAWFEKLDTWMAAEHAKKDYFVLGAVPETALRWLRANGKPVPPTAEVVIFDNLPRGPKQLRHEAAGNALTLDEWRALPAMIDRPAALYFDTRSGNLIFVADGLGPGKLAVEFAPKETRRMGDYNQVAGAFRVDDATVAGQVKGGEWVVVDVPGSRAGVEPT